MNRLMRRKRVTREQMVKFYQKARALEKAKEREYRWHRRIVRALRVLFGGRR